MIPAMHIKRLEDAAVRRRTARSAGNASDRTTRQGGHGAGRVVARRDRSTRKVEMVSGAVAEKVLNPPGPAHLANPMASRSQNTGGMGARIPVMLAGLACCSPLEALEGTPAVGDTSGRNSLFHRPKDISQPGERVFRVGSPSPFGASYRRTGAAPALGPPRGRTFLRGGPYPAPGGRQDGSRSESGDPSRPSSLPNPQRWAGHGRGGARHERLA
jgi:hypothetical protein